MDITLPPWLAQTVASLPPWVWILLLFTGAVAAGLILQALAFTILRRLLSWRHAEGLRAAVEASRRPAQLILPILMLLAVLPISGLGLSGAAALSRILGVALVAAFGFLLLRMAGVGFDRALQAEVGKVGVEARRRRTQLNLFRRLTVIAIGVATAGFVLMAIPAVRDMGVSIFASAGVAGLVIGLAAQPTISNLIAGIQIAIAQPIRIGDVVIVENEWGTIEEISSTYVVVAIWDQRRLVLPLSYFLQKPFQNWTRTSPQIIQPVFVYADYTMPVEDLRRKMMEVLKGSPLWDGRVGVLQVTDLKEHSMEVRIIVSTEDAGKSWDLRCLLREEIVGFMARNYPGSLPRSRIEGGVRMAPAPSGAGAGNGSA